MRDTFYQKLRQADPLTVFRALAHLPNFVRLYWRLFWDPRVFVLPKALLVLALAYALSPIDLLFDVLPVFGWADDLVVVILALGTFMRLCPPLVVQEHVQIIDEERGVHGGGSRE
jgi:uncharacterized membrane protein YkvA (DUF1232 family)